MPTRRSSGSTMIRLGTRPSTRFSSTQARCGASMRNIVEHGQTSGSSETTVLSGVSSSSRLHQVDLGADTDHRAGRARPRRPRMMKSVEPTWSASVAHLVGALGVHDRRCRRGARPGTPSMCSGWKRWWTEQWPFHSRNVRSLRRRPRRGRRGPGGGSTPPCRDRRSPSGSRCCGRGAGRGRTAPVSPRGRNAHSSTARRVGTRCTPRRRCGRRRPSGRPTSSCR